MHRRIGGSPWARAALIVVGVCSVSEAFAQESVEANVDQPQTEAEAQSAPPPAAEPALIGAATRDDHVRALGALDVTERVDAARALAELADPATVSALSQALRSDPNPVVRGWIVRALGEINNAQARAAITMAAQQDADDRVRQLAGELIPEARAAAPQVYDPAMYAHVEREPRRQHRPGRGLRVGGWVILGASYGISMISGTIGMLMDPEIMWPMLLPTIGPAISGTYLIRDGWDEEVAFGVIGWIMSALQITGLTMAIVGHVRGRRAREEETASRLTFALTPVTGPNGLVGLSAVGSF